MRKQLGRDTADTYAPNDATFESDSIREPELNYYSLIKLNKTLGFSLFLVVIFASLFKIPHQVEFIGVEGGGPKNSKLHAAPLTNGSKIGIFYECTVHHGC